MSKTQAYSVNNIAQNVHTQTEALELSCQGNK